MIGPQGGFGLHGCQMLVGSQHLFLSFCVETGTSTYEPTYMLYVYIPYCHWILL